jgi:hypothetical protein
MVKKRRRLNKEREEEGLCMMIVVRAPLCGFVCVYGLDGGGAGVYYNNNYIMCKEA